MPDGRKVTAIPARVQRYATEHMLQTNRPRVAAYARVSTDQEEQETSFEAQCDYYSKLIRGNPAWEYAGLYTDDGVSATSTARREGFNRLIADALDGKIDRIITKSVSRFARNTVDSLTTIRRLKEKGVGVTFEKENIDTLDSKGELMITIMSSLAQEESRSISENVTWGWRKRISDGKVSVAYSHFLGYEKGEDGSMQVVESEAKIVRQIYGMFLDGQTPSSIAAFLTKQRISTPAGKEKWQSSTVKSILTNEKYKGDALLQKTFTVDFLSKKAKINEGEVPQYYVEKSHPAIVSAEVFDLAQYEMKRRTKKGRHTSAASIFSDKLVCGECGAVYGSKVWHSTDAYRTMIWRCNEKYAVKGQPCPSPHLRDEEIQHAFVQAINQVLEQKEEILSALQEALAGLTDVSRLECECDRLQAEQDVVARQMSRMIRENAEVAQNQAEYNARLQPLEERYEALKSAMLRAKEAISEQTGRRRRLEAFMRELRESSLLTVFDERVFLGTVERITVFKGASRDEKRLVFRFKDGRDVAVTL